MARQEQEDQTDPVNEALQIAKAYPTLSPGYLSRKLHKSLEWFIDKLHLYKLNDISRWYLERDGLKIANAILLAKLTPAEQDDVVHRAATMNVDDFAALIAAHNKDKVSKVQLPVIQPAQEIMIKFRELEKYQRRYYKLIRENIQLKADLEETNKAYINARRGDRSNDAAYD